MSKPDKPLEEMTRDEKVAAGYRPMRCSKCVGTGFLWNAKLRGPEKCPQCDGAKFFWLPGPKPREAGE